jgi:glycosyltransferase involved in cell wall biosynthesis
MRILFPYMARWHSANRTRYHHLLTALARRGHRVIVIQPPPRPGAPETNYQDMPGADVPGIEVRDVAVPAFAWNPTLPFDKLWKKGVATLAARRSLREAAGREAIDVLLLYNIPQVVFAGARDAVVAVDIADDLPAMLARESGRAASAILPAARLAWRRLLRAADVVTAASAPLAAPLAGRAEIIPNGADLAAAARADGRAVRARHPGPLVGYVGAFEYFVDLDLVLDVAERLAGACTVLLVGGGRDWARTREAAERRGLRHIRFTGPVPYAEALDHMAALDVALIPFRPGPVADAACPLKLFEYLALGRPVVASRDAEMLRIASPWIDFATSIDDWTDRIRDLLQRPEGASAKIRRARADIEAHHRWDRLAERFEKILAEAVARRQDVRAAGRNRR